MKLSVIIPVYNAEKYLRACLDSVLQQDLTDLEVICVDDDSSDASPSIVEEYCRMDSRVLLIRNPSNLYAGACRNTGLLAAQGEYVHFLDADDLVEKGAYSRYYALAEAVDADIVKGRCSCFDNATGEVSTTPLLDLSDVPEECFGNVITFQEHPRAFSHISVVPWNGIYKRSFLLAHDIRFNRLICVNDRSFYNEATLLAERILLTKELLIRYRINNSQSLVGVRARNFHCQLQSFALVKEQCRKYDISGSLLSAVLERELVDLFIWYRKYSKVPEVQEAVTKLTREFARSLDISPLQNYAPAFKWYYDYLLLTRPEILTVAVHLEGAEDTLTACLESIQNQSVTAIAVYGIGRDERGQAVFRRFMELDERFRGLCPELAGVPRSTPYFFETWPKEYKKSGDFKNRIKKIMADSTDLRPQERLIWQPENTRKDDLKKDSLLKKAVRIFKRFRDE